MRMHLIVAAGLLLSLALPLFAEETTESLAKRVKELEKANIAQQEDIGHTQIDLANAQASLKKTIKALDDEIAARTTLAGLLDQETAARKAQAEAMGKQILELKTANDAAHAVLTGRIDTQDKALAALAAKHEEDKAALQQQIADLTNALNKERAERMAADEAQTKALMTLAKDNKRAHTIMSIVGAILGGIAISR